MSTKRTLSHSIHKLASILGPELTMSDLIGVFNKFLEDGNPQVREGAFKTMHIFLNEVEEKERPKYIGIIKRTYDNAPKSQWRTKALLAKNLNKYVNLFDLNIVTTELLPMFFMFLDDRNTSVSEAVATALAPILMKYSG